MIQIESLVQHPALSLKNTITRFFTTVTIIFITMFIIIIIYKSAQESQG